MSAKTLREVRLTWQSSRVPTLVETIPMARSQQCRSAAEPFKPLFQVVIDFAEPMLTGAALGRISDLETESWA